MIPTCTSWYVSFRWHDLHRHLASYSSTFPRKYALRVYRSEEENEDFYTTPSDRKSQLQESRVIPHGSTFSTILPHSDLGTRHRLGYGCDKGWSSC